MKPARSSTDSFWFAGDIATLLSACLFFAGLLSVGLGQTNERQTATNTPGVTVGTSTLVERELLLKHRFEKMVPGLFVGKEMRIGDLCRLLQFSSADMQPALSVSRILSARCSPCKGVTFLTAESL